MNNTVKAKSVSAILSHKSTDFELKTVDTYFEITMNEIERKLCTLEINDKNLKTLKAIRFLLDSINY